jgi:hypothetical protein
VESFSTVGARAGDPWETQYYKRQAVRDGEENAFEKRRDDRRKRKFRHFLEEFLEFD